MIDINQIVHKYEEALVTALETIGNEVVSNAQANLSGPSPSSPGSYPGMVTGQLRDSIHDNVDIQGNDVVLRIYTDDEEGKVMALEYGSINMAPRPFMRPIAIELQQKANTVATLMRNY